jgi:hypothetical protein
MTVDQAQAKVDEMKADPAFAADVAKHGNKAPRYGEFQTYIQLIAAGKAQQRGT